MKTTQTENTKLNKEEGLIQNNLDLSLGMSTNTGHETSIPKSKFMGSSNAFTNDNATKRMRFDEASNYSMNSGNVFIDPWSLAARQQKAVFEQARPLNTTNFSSSPQVSRFSHLPIIGWPPIQASRKNLVSPNTVKTEMDEEKNSRKGKVNSEENNEKDGMANQEAMIKSAMFVKVNMEGLSVGRKINLNAHHSYESLSCALQTLFVNFTSSNYTTNLVQEEKEDVLNSNHVILYEDNEGDRMLVGDVPWELFLTSVKRLYITGRTKTTRGGSEIACTEILAPVILS